MNAGVTESDLRGGVRPGLAAAWPGRARNGPLFCGMGKMAAGENEETGGPGDGREAADAGALPARGAGTAVPARRLTRGERDTLADMIRRGSSPATARALRGDLAYLEAWCLAAFGEDLAWPADPVTIAAFLAHHLFDAGQRAVDPDHGMPPRVERSLRDDGYLTGRMPPALSTIERRLASWSKLHGLRDMESPLRSREVRDMKRRLIAGFDGASRRKSPEPVTIREILALLDRCLDPLDPRDLRDRALIATMYATGGRRRSEMGRMLVRHLDFSRVPADPADPLGEQVRAMRVSMPATKTTRAGENEVWAIGLAADAVYDWLKSSGQTVGGAGEARVFPRFFARRRPAGDPRPPELFADFYGDGLSGEGVRLILRRRLIEAGLDPERYSPHGIRAGFLTDAQRQGVPLAEAMRLSLHRSEKQAMRYYAESAVTGRAARLLNDARRPGAGGDGAPRKAGEEREGRRDRDA